MSSHTQSKINLKFLSLLGLLTFMESPVSPLFSLFPFFLLWGNSNRWLRLFSYLGFGGFVGIVIFIFKF